MSTLTTDCLPQVLSIIYTTEYSEDVQLAIQSPIVGLQTRQVTGVTYQI